MTNKESSQRAPRPLDCFFACDGVRLAMSALQGNHDEEAGRDKLIKKSVPLNTSFGDAGISKKHCKYLVLLVAANRHVRETIGIVQRAERCKIEEIGS